MSCNIPQEFLRFGLTEMTYVPNIDSDVGLYELREAGPAAGPATVWRGSKAAGQAAVLLSGCPVQGIPCVLLRPICRLVTGCRPGRPLPRNPEGSNGTNRNAWDAWRMCFSPKNVGGSWQKCTPPMVLVSHGEAALAQDGSAGIHRRVLVNSAQNQCQFKAN